MKHELKLHYTKNELTELRTDNNYDELEELHKLYAKRDANEFVEKLFRDEEFNKISLLDAIYDHWGEKTYRYAVDIDAGVDVLKGIYKNGY